jgi:hypothetical protein
MRPDKKRRPAEDRTASDWAGGLKSESTLAPWEPSAWLRAAIGRRVQQLKAAGVNKTLCDVVVGSATGTWDPVTAAGTTEDRRCDRCSVYVPPPLTFWAAVLEVELDDVKALLVVGLCRRCRDAERVA